MQSVNFVNNFADLNVEMADELRAEIEANKDKRVAEVWSELSDMLASLKINATQIAKHGERANAIVKNMMEHASGSGSRRCEVGVNAFVEEYVTLAYQEKSAQIPSLDLEVRRDYDASAGNVAMAPQEMGRVFLNVLNNALPAGSGLGLSLSYDIVTKGHGGHLVVESRPGDGATFIITLPV